MSLIVEDGTGLATAESYISVAYADAYHTAMGNAGWTGADSVKEAALRRATQYMDGHYRFRGDQNSPYVQALEWPRVLDGYIWPVKKVQDACAELALNALNGELVVDQEDRPVTEETVGPVTVKYGESQLGGQVRFANVDNILSKFIISRYAMRLDRA